MRNRIAAAALGLALLGVPAVAQADNNREKSNGLSPCELQYIDTWQQVNKENAGPDNGFAGRHIVDDGVQTQHGTREPTAAECREGVGVMRRMLNPAPAPEPAPESTYTETTATYAPAASSTVMCESGGDYAANTGNGYYGGYQFDSGTWDAYGDPQYAEASDAPPSVQDAAAASVPYDAWPNCP